MNGLRREQFIKWNNENKTEEIEIEWINNVMKKKKVNNDFYIFLLFCYFHARTLSIS